MVRHGGILDGLFTSQHEKKKDEYSYMNVQNTIDKSIKDNNDRIEALAKQREEYAKMTVKKQFTSSKGAQ